MKPKKGEDCVVEMEEPAQDPLELVKQLVLLIVEARTPDVSAKGRVEGPHCPVIRGGPPHHCARDNGECLRAREFCGSAQQLWTNEIPICLDIFLFPDCRHGRQEVMVTEGTVTSMAWENALLVERWMLVSERRRHDNRLGSNLLLQAVRSYLHFSQISSWLYSEKGRLPSLLAYRIYAPGEETCMDFSSNPDNHVFPLCVSGYDALKVSVSALQRLSQVPVLMCATDIYSQGSSAKNDVKSHAKEDLPMENFEDLYTPKAQAFPRGLPDTGLSVLPKDSEKGYQCGVDTDTKGLAAGKHKLRPRKTQKQDFDDGKVDCYGFCKNGSGSLKSSQPEMFGQTTKDGYGLECGSRKEVLKEYKNGTEGTRMWQSQDSDRFDQTADGRWNPKARYRKKDAERDQRIEQMKMAFPYDGEETDLSCNSPSRKITCDTKRKKSQKKHDGQFPILMLDSPDTQKEKFWMEFSQDCVDEMDRKHLRQNTTYFACETSRKKSSVNETYSPDKWSSLKSSKMDVGGEWYKTNATTFRSQERKSNLAASEAFEEEFIRRLSERMSLAKTKPSKKSHFTESNAAISESRKQHGQRKTDLESDLLLLSPTKKNENVDNHRGRLSTSHNSISTSPLITDATNNSLPVQAFKESLGKVDANLNVNFTQSNAPAVPSQRSSQPMLSQLSVDISMSESEFEWDSDHTPTASPNHLNSSRSNADSLFKVITTRQMREAVNGVERKTVEHDSVTNVFEDQYEASTLLESVSHDKGFTVVPHGGEFQKKSMSKGSRSDLQMMDEPKLISYSSYANRQDENESPSHNDKVFSETLSRGNDSSSLNNSKPGSQCTRRKIFEENLLPLASYDAQTDSFKTVDPSTQGKVLHSPKVLLSCDVPYEASLESSRCINFETVANSEVFASRLDEIESKNGITAGIGSYMPTLAAVFLNDDVKHHQKDCRNGKETEATHASLQCSKEMVKTQEAELVVKPTTCLSFSATENGHREEDTGDNLSKLFSACALDDHQNSNSFGCLLVSTSITKDSSSSESSPLPAYSSSPSSSSLSSSLTNCSSLSPHPLLSSSPASSSHSSHSAPSPMISPTSHESNGYLQDGQNEEGPQEFSSSPSSASAMDFAQGEQTRDLQQLSHNSAADETFAHLNCGHSFSSAGPQIVWVEHEGRSLGVARDSKHSSNLSSCSDKTHTPHTSTAQQQQPLHQRSNGTANDADALSSLSSPKFVAKRQHQQPCSQESTESRLPVCMAEMDSTDNSMSALPSNNYHETADSNKENDKGILHGISSTMNTCTSLDLGSHPNNHFTSDGSSSKITQIETQKSALKDDSAGLSQPVSDSISPTTATTTITPTTTAIAMSNGGVLKHPRVFSLLAKTKKTSSPALKVSSDVSDGKALIGSSFFQVNAINDKSLQASQRLSFQTTCDIEHHQDESYNTHASSSVCNSMASDGVHPPYSSDLALFGTPISSLSLPPSPTPPPSSAASSSAQPTMLQYMDSYASNNNNLAINKNIMTDNNNMVYEKTHNGTVAPVAISKSESILGERPPVSNLIGNGHSLSQEVTHRSGQNELSSVSTKPSEATVVGSLVENGAPILENLCNEGSDPDPPSLISSQINAPSAETPFSGKSYSADDCFVHDSKAKASRCVGNELNCSSVPVRWNGSDDMSFEANDDGDSEVFFYLDDKENSSPGLNHHSSLASSLMLSSSSLLADSRPFSSNGAMSYSVSTEAGLDLSCSPGADLETSPFARPRMPSYGENHTGWSPTPPHRSVSTPDCAEREVRGRGYQRSTCSRSISSVIPQIDKDGIDARSAALKSSSMIFNSRTSLPTQSSPAPLKRKPGGRFDYDASLLNVRAIKSAFSCSKLALGTDKEDADGEDKTRTLSTSAPASTNCLLGNFEESILNGRIDPVGTVDGFSAEIGASGSFCPKHLHLPVSAFFFALSDDNAPSPYLGHINLSAVSKKGYHIPKKGTVQVTLFNPNKTVVKMFVVMYDLSDMPPSSQTFIRQRTMYIPCDRNSTAPSYLRYLIHLRCSSSRSAKIYLHTDIRLIFARHKLDIDAKTVPYEMKSYTDVPRNPKYSPKK